MYTRGWATASVSGPFRRRSSRRFAPDTGPEVDRCPFFRIPPDWASFMVQLTPQDSVMPRLPVFPSATSTLSFIHWLRQRLCCTLLWLVVADSLWPDRSAFTPSTEKSERTCFPSNDYYILYRASMYRYILRIFAFHSFFFFFF